MTSLIRIKTGALAGAAAFALLLAGSASAAATMEDLEKRLEAVEGEVIAKDAEGQTALDNKIAGAIADAVGHVELHGFVDTTFLTQENIDLITGNGTPDTDDEISNTFNLNQVELRLSASSEWASFLAEVEFFQNPVNYFPADGLNATNSVDLEQGWVAITPPMLPGTALKLGKFNAPIGLESLDPDARDTVTNSAVFNRLAPFNLTGANLSYYGEVFGFEALVANGYDADSNGLNGNKELTYGVKGQATFGPVTGVFTFLGGSGDLSGSMEANDKTYIYDGVITFAPEISDDFGFSTGFEFSYGTIENFNVVGDSGDTEWFGFIGRARIDVGDFGTTFRFDYIDDRDGFVAGNESGDLWSITVSPSYAITDNMFVRLEYRYDETVGGKSFLGDSTTMIDPMTMEEVYVGLKPKNSNNTGFAQFVYHF